MRFVLQEKPMSVKFLVFFGGGGFGFWGGGSARFYFYGRVDFSDIFCGKENFLTGARRCVLFFQGS